MKKIPLTKGQVALVDDSDYAALSKHKWSSSKGYAVRCIWNHTPGHCKIVRMHRAILKAPDGVQVDHIDGNKSNNQRSNLRLCTGAQNHQNVKRSARNTSGFKGVHFHKGAKKWRAQIVANKKRFHLGYFSTAKAAKKAWNAASLELHKEFSHE